MSTLKGVFVVMTTPFNEDGSIHYEGIEQNLEYYIDSGVQGILIAGATGEFGVMTLEERKAVAAFALARINGRVPAVVGATAARAATTIEVAQHAAEHGAAGVMVLPPPGAGLDDEEIFRFYKEVNDHISIPIMVYNNPGSSGVDIQIDLLHRLAELDRVDCIKESTGDVRRISMIREQLGDRLGIFCGWEDMAYESFMAGATGWVCVCANFAPKLSVDLYQQTALEKDYEEGWKTFCRLLPALRFLEAGKLIQAAKGFQNARDLSGGYCRSPRLPLSADEQQEIRNILETTAIH